MCVVSKAISKDKSQTHRKRSYPNSMTRMWNPSTFSVLRIISLLFLFLTSTIFRVCDGLSTNPKNYNARPNAGEITHRASAIFALMESMKKKNAIAIRILEQDPAYLNLDQRDRAFARLLLSTAERRSGQIQAVIQSFQRKDTKKKKNTRVSHEMNFRFRTAATWSADLVSLTISNFRLPTPKKATSFRYSCRRSTSHWCYPDSLYGCRRLCCSF